MSGCYDGYDENGSTHTRDWHGFTKDRRPVAHLGTASEPPFAWIGTRRCCPHRATFRCAPSCGSKSSPDLSYETPVVDGLSIPRRSCLSNWLLRRDQPVPFWSRAGREMRCAVAPGRRSAELERAVLARGGLGRRAGQRRCAVYLERPSSACCGLGRPRRALSSDRDRSRLAAARRQRDSSLVRHRTPRHRGAAARPGADDPVPKET